MFISMRIRFVENGFAYGLLRFKNTLLPYIKASYDGENLADSHSPDVSYIYC